jgi:hypothetical protein
MLIRLSLMQRPGTNHLSLTARIAQALCPHNPKCLERQPDLQRAVQHIRMSCESGKRFSAPQLLPHHTTSTMTRKVQLGLKSSAVRKFHWPGRLRHGATRTTDSEQSRNIFLGRLQAPVSSRGISLSSTEDKTFSRPGQLFRKEGQFLPRLGPGPWWRSHASVEHTNVGCRNSRIAPA